jgi:hypothetical protein
VGLQYTGLLLGEPSKGVSYFAAPIASAALNSLGGHGCRSTAPGNAPTPAATRDNHGTDWSWGMAEC